MPVWRVRLYRTSPQCRPTCILHGIGRTWPTWHERGGIGSLAANAGRGSHPGRRCTVRDGGLARFEPLDTGELRKTRRTPRECPGRCDGFGPGNDADAASVSDREQDLPRPEHDG